MGSTAPEGPVRGTWRRTRRGRVHQRRCQVPHASPTPPPAPLLGLTNGESGRGQGLVAVRVGGGDGVDGGGGQGGGGGDDGGGDGSGSDGSAGPAHTRAEVCGRVPVVCARRCGAVRGTLRRSSARRAHARAAGWQGSATQPSCALRTARQRSGRSALGRRSWSAEVCLRGWRDSRSGRTWHVSRRT